ncbi:UDP-N-acetylmuramate--L-alanine ligase [Nocardioides sp. WL0053]|uniref:UDP-N-acetylmuramate--L-alanine ligase n=1 Tax=Nocardioides jiangsuensis TaxID=2866161 RepID=A0ABS7RFA5_9ACTN|nr:UDP-N-acetylmuramate--L-alanine ligase [Nocardioides jiangsuensis]MBY9073697.1 UDP-N-acetylmuramate--L-alanine ligase [Nocardioides jiangsuensis]
MIVPVPDELLPADRLGRVHFVGIGGAGLSGIARIMLARGITVSGSDAKESRTIEALRALGARCDIGHDASHVRDVDTLVVSTAVREDNPEVVEARRQGLRLLPRSAALESVMQGRRVVAVAGTHGKTTTTSLLTVALQHCAADPSFAIGGELNESGSNAHDGSGDLFVAEADESDGAFLVYSPYAALVTNVEADHLDNWGTEEAYHAAFTDFLDRISPDGFLVACVDDDGAADLVRQARERGMTAVGVGESPEADLRAEGLVFAGSTSTFTVVDRGRRLGEVSLQIPGRHYVLDALAALAAGLRLGFSFTDLRRGLEAFSGTRRRMELKGEVGGIRVYDSYAHHPNEIAGDLQAARSVVGEGRLVVAFQPHLVSRTKIFGAQMGEALGAADEVVVMDVYVAREDPEPGVNGAMVASHVPLPADRVVFEPSWSATPQRLVERARPGDVVLTLGAGDVTLVGPEVLVLLAERSGDAAG